MVGEPDRTQPNPFEPDLAEPNLTGLAAREEELADFLAEVYIRAEGTPRSVAQATGLM